MLLVLLLFLFVVAGFFFSSWFIYKYSIQVYHSISSSQLLIASTWSDLQQLLYSKTNKIAIIMVVVIIIIIII